MEVSRAKLEGVLLIKAVAWQIAQRNNERGRL